MNDNYKTCLIFAALRPELKPLHKAYPFKPIAHYKTIYQCTLKDLRGRWVPEQSSHFMQLGEQNGKVQAEPADLKLVIAYTGIGLKRAGKMAAEIIPAIKPDFILSLGTCGGLDATLKVGDLVLAQEVGRRVQTADAFTVLQADQNLLKKAHAVCDQHKVNYTMGRLISSPKAVAEPEEKLQLGKSFQAHAVDMESAALAEQAQAHGIAFLCVRGILDTADRSLFSHSEELGPDNQGNLARPFAKYMLKHPFDIKKVPFLWQATRKVAHNLKCFTVALMNDWNV